MLTDSAVSWRLFKRGLGKWFWLTAKFPNTGPLNSLAAS